MPVEDVESLLPRYDAMLANASYSKVWQELSGGDRQLRLAIATSESDKVYDIRACLGEQTGDDDPNRFNQRSRRLKSRGIAVAPQRGSLAFTLPRLVEFVREAIALYGA